MTFHQIEIGELFVFNRNFMIKHSAFQSQCVDVFSSWYAFGESTTLKPYTEVTKVLPIQFAEIAAGKMFIYEGAVYLKAVHVVTDVWAVNFSTGEIKSLESHTLVFPIN